VPSSRPDRDRRIYQNPRLYDLAFAFRDVQKECDGLLALSKVHGLGKPRGVVELACGPAHHLREFARRGIAGWGVDVSPDMLGYAKELCARDGVKVGFQRADMRSYALKRRVDLALCLFDSFTHCTTDADGIAALQATGAALRRGGLLIIEVTHPADYFDSNDRRTLSRWSQRYPDVSVTSRYGVAHRDAVAETYIATLTIEARFRDGRPARKIVSRQQHRMWVRSGISNIAARSGMFEVAGWCGDLETRVPLSMKRQSWRMVAILRRT
jgi:SAM-dependent methyltransferase